MTTAAARFSISMENYLYFFRSRLQRRLGIDFEFANPKTTRVYIATLAQG